MSNVDPTGATNVGRWLQIYVASGENFGGCTQDGVTIPCSQLSNSGATNVLGSCIYLNDTGTGVDQQYGNGIDNNSNSSECQANGGYFAPGSVNVSSISINPDGGSNPLVDSSVSFTTLIDGIMSSGTDTAPGFGGSADSSSFQSALCHPLTALWAGSTASVASGAGAFTSLGGSGSGGALLSLGGEAAPELAAAVELGSGPVGWIILGGTVAWGLYCYGK